MPSKRAQPAKLTRPRLYGTVPRPRLFARLDELREHSVVWIAGPPGAGKTTLAASYVDAARLPFLWYQIDAGDGDPATFFFYLRQAVAALAPRRTKPLPLLTPEYLVDVAGFSRRYFRQAFAQLPGDVVFVLDNYHEIAPKSSLHKAIAAGLEEIPLGANALILSRSDLPPAFARALLGGTVACLPWNELRLAPDEAEAIAAARGLADAATARALQTHCDGWMAGVTLMLERAGDLLPTASPRQAARADSLETVFDYFSGSIYEQAGVEAQDVWLKTALLPRVTAALAEVLTGDAAAIRHVKALHQRHLFTDRRPGEEESYEYHALFRTFLTSRARAVLSNDERLALMQRAARHVESQGRAEEAFLLYAESANGPDMERVLMAHAATLIAQGRWITLREWVDCLPAARLEENPWLRYWLGRSQILVDARLAPPILEAAYNGFLGTKNATGQLLAAAAVLEALYYRFDDLRLMDPWIERTAPLLASGVVLASMDDNLRLHAALMIGAIYRAPAHPALARCVARVKELLAHPLEVNLKVAVASMLHGYSHSLVDGDAQRIAIREARPLLDSPHLTAQRAAFYYVTEGYSHYMNGRYCDALACYDRADAIASEHGLDNVALTSGSQRGLCERWAKMLSEAEATIGRLNLLRKPASGLNPAMFELLCGAVAFDRGDFNTFIEHAARAQTVVEKSGQYNAIMLISLVNANMFVAMGKLAAAEKLLAHTRLRYLGPATSSYLAAIAFNEAWLAERQSQCEQRDSLLREALVSARDERAKMRLRWYDNALAALLPIALERDIESETARRLIREFNIRPDSHAAERWPWPVKIYTLGRFALLLDDQPITFSRKAPKKTIALLKVLIAMGGLEVDEQRLIDALWPDDEGDAAHRSFNSALHRLRKLLGSNDFIRQSGGALSLDPQRCWVDVWAFERLVEGSGDLEEALSLYRGGFLADDTDASWAVVRREGLRGKFVRAAETAGRRLENASPFDEAIALYLRGIDADNLIEPFYQGLMRCYDRLGRASEAASAFRRLRQTLSVTLGAEPSTASRKLFHELRLS